MSEREPLVLLHGLSGCALQWEPVLGPLSRHHRVLCPTLAGHLEGARLPADRTGPLWAIYSLATQVERDMDAAGIDTAHVGGNSLGGWLGLELARRGRARSVVALSPAGGWEQGSSEQRRARRAMLSNYRGLRIAGPLARPLTRLAWLRRRVLGSVMAHGDRLSHHHAAEILRSAWRCPAYLELLDELVDEGPRFSFEGINVPVTIAWGHRRPTAPARLLLGPLSALVAPRPVRGSGRPRPHPDGRRS
jgi:pimeloyl-ACP methyl ester carboxylesterase